MLHFVNDEEGTQDMSQRRLPHLSACSPGWRVALRMTLASLVGTGLPSSASRRRMCSPVCKRAQLLSLLDLKYCPLETGSRFRVATGFSSAPVPAYRA